MTARLNDIWEKAALWPSASTSYLAHLSTTPGATPNNNIESLDDLNLHASSARDDLSNLRTRRVEAFKTLCQQPSPEHAKQAYDLLVAHKDCNVNVLTPLKTDPENLDTAGSFLLFIILNSPHKVALKNALVLLSETETRVETDVLKTCSADEFLIHHLFPLCIRGDLAAAEEHTLMRVLAENGNYDAQEYLYEHLTDDSPDELRTFLLQQAQFAVEPAFETYNGFDTAYNPEYHPHILEFAQRTRLAEALRAESIDDQLVTAALSFFSNLSACWLENVDWSEFEAVIPATEMLTTLLEHLKDRALSLDQIGDLAFIFDTLFSDPLAWVEAEPQKQISADLRITSQAMHLAIARDIYAILHARPQNQLLENALSSMSHPDFDQALRISLLITKEDPFDVVFPYLKRELPRKPNIRVSFSALTVCFKAAEHNREKAQLLAHWCADYCRFERSGGYFPGPGYEFILSNALRMVKLFPGVGKTLVTAGLDAQSPARQLSAEVLTAWPVDQWPANVSWRIDSAMKKEEATLALLARVQRKQSGSSD